MGGGMMDSWVTAPIQGDEGGGAFGAVLMLIWLGFIVLIIASFWKVFTKAGQPGWASIVPIYNLIVLIQISGRPLWFFVLFFIPVANLIAIILIMIDIAKKFGKGPGFGLGLALLGIIFFPILAFGDAQYNAQA